MHTIRFIILYFIFINISCASFSIKDCCNNIWLSNSIYINPFLEIYGYGNTKEYKKICSSLFFSSNDSNFFYLDDRILLSSKFSDIDVRFLYESRFSIAKAEFFDIKAKEYRRFLLTPILTYKLDSRAYKSSTLINEDYGVLSFSDEAVFADFVRIPFQGIIEKYQYKRNLNLKLLNNHLEYNQRFKTRNGTDAIESVKYYRSNEKYSLGELNSFTEKVLYYFMLTNFVGNKNISFEEVISNSIKFDEKACRQIKFVGNFLKSLSGDWTYCKSNQKNDVSASTFSKPYVYLFFDFEKKDSIFFTDYVLEDEVLDFGIYSKDEFLSTLPDNRKYLNHIKYVDTGMKDFSNLKIKPFLILFFNPSESRLYLCKYNEVKFNKGKNINLSTYSSFYFYDIPFGKNIPLNIEWKTDYSNFNERNIIRSPRSLKWEISDDFTEIKEYRKDGENWILQSTMKKIVENKNKKQDTLKK